MKFLKALALTILSFLLFFSISALSMVITLNHTILNADFVVTELDRLDIVSIAQDTLGGAITHEYIPDETLAEVTGDTIADLEPWIREQINTAVYTAYDYLQSRSDSLSVEMSLEPVREALRDNLWQAFLREPPTGMEGIPPAELEPYFNDFFQAFTAELPDSFSFDESDLSPDALALLHQIREYLSYYQRYAFIGLIGLIALLILGIILIRHDMRGITRELGTIFLTFGIIEYGSFFVAKYLAENQLERLGIPMVELPPWAQDWLPHIIDASFAPLKTLGLALLISGVILLVVSFVYKPHQSSP
jgi:hypothetical protein